MKKKTVFTTLLFFLGTIIGHSQDSQPSESTQGSSNLGSLTILLPTGEFAHTHTIGAGLYYTWSRSRFGYFDGEKLKRIGFIVGTGVEYYFGKKDISTAGHAFSFQNYFNFQLMPGVMYNFHKKAELNLAAGPALALHGGTASFAFGSGLYAGYYIQPNLSIGAGVLYKKHEYVNALWSVGLRSSYSF